MGKIKSTLIKKTGRLLLLEENNFNTDFDHNKRLLGNSMPSKKTRNKIAGYIAKLNRRKNREKTAKLNTEVQNE